MTPSVDVRVRECLASWPALTAREIADEIGADVDAVRGVLVAIGAARTPVRGQSHRWDLPAPLVAESIEDIHILLRECRESAGLSQDALAALVGVHRRTVHRHEAGMASPSIALMARWAQVCGYRIRISRDRT